MISDARRGHVSPGIYTEEKDVVFSVKSLGITSLGLVGETLYGPAFQNVEISNWGEFVDYFGGTSPEKFKNGSPKYGLPYIAKSYLEESKRLNVVRVLGLSGYNAGKAWVVKNGNKPVLILRSKMTFSDSSNPCMEPEDTPTEIVSSITIGEYKQSLYNDECVEESTSTKSTSTAATTISGSGKFSVIVTLTTGEKYTYNVSLHSSDSDYIYNVISSRPDKGDSPIYIEALYESSFDNSYTPSSTDINVLTGETTATAYYKITKEISGTTPTNNNYIYEVEKTEKSNDAIQVEKNNISNGVYTTSASVSIDSVIYVAETNDIYNDYKDAYRAAQTPWIVSEAVTSGNTCNMRKLFRFITISDGDASNFQVKVSIENIDVKMGTFDVVVRDYYDTDANPIILETFRRCNLIEGDVNYIAHRIGTSDGGFVSKSKYILIEMAEGEDFGKSFPAGFLGYPMPTYGLINRVFDMKYNTIYKPEVKTKRQYFGISDITGVDNDVFTYKGRYFYNEEPEFLTSGFHMDSVVSGNCTVDNVSGYNFTGVSTKRVMNTSYAPRLINMNYIDDTIYKDIKVRKFTVCFYGGFDGWDLNRPLRTNTDEYKATQYNVNGSAVFSNVINENSTNLPLNLPTTAITSDYYAYLAGCRVFANPQDVDINLLATPGINWYDNAMLTEEIIDVVEDYDEGRGGDALYIMEAPGPNTVEVAMDAVDAFKTVDINSSYACTYFPWVMYYDASNKRYLNLPVTKDVVKNMAAVDNNSYPWFAPAGTERGKVNCVKAAYKTRLSDEDALYEANINPVKSFAQDGVIIWGNKTAYPVETPNNRINVRRMMIRLKKLIVNAAKNLIFEQYDEELEKQFRGIVEPILADVKANRGIIDYRVITESTPETRDQHILPAKILVKPVQALEYISISFVVYPESVKFDE